METVPEQPIPAAAGTSATTDGSPSSGEMTPGGDASAIVTGSSASGSLDELLSTLTSLLKTFDESLKDVQAKAQAATRGRAQTQSSLNQVTKASDALTGTTADARTAIKEAGAAREFAEDTIDTLDDEDQQRLASAIEKINDDYRDAEEALANALGALETHERDAKALDAKVADKKKAADTAAGPLATLPATIKERIAPLKSLAKNLRAAAEAGQAMKAFVLRSELDATIAGIQRQMDEATVSALVEALNGAQKDLLDAYETQGEHAAKLAGLQATAKGAQAAFNEQQKKRPRKLEDLYVARDQAPASAHA